MRSGLLRDGVGDGRAVITNTRRAMASSSASSFKLTRTPVLPARRELFDAVFFFADTERSIAKGPCN
jgi:hypothetical protein